MLGVIIVVASVLGTAAAVLCLAFWAGVIEVFFHWLTNRWYGAVVQKLPPGSRLLDIGSGLSGVKTFGELVSGVKFNTIIGIVQKLLAMEIKVVGIEENGELFKKAAGTMIRCGLRHSVLLHNKSIYDKDLLQVFNGVSRFNAICFSRPLMSLPDPVAALRVSASLLKDGGVVYIPQVLNYPPSMTLQLLSPFFKLLHIAPIAEVRNVVAEADMEVIDDLPAVGVDGKKPHAARVLVLQRRELCTASHVKQGAPSDGNVRSRKGVESQL